MAAFSRHARDRGRPRPGPTIAAALLWLVAACDRQGTEPASAGTAASGAPTVAQGALHVTYPPPGAVFPRDMVAPIVRWRDTNPAVGAWRVTLEFGGRRVAATERTNEQKLRLSAALWEALRGEALDREVRVTVEGLGGDSSEARSRGSTTLRISRDEVGAPIFYRDVPLPFAHAKRNKRSIRWRLGRADSPAEPPVVLEDVGTCANCHSFARDGSVLGMNVRFGEQRGDYTLSRIDKETRIDDETTIRFADLHPGDPGYRTGAFFNAISPDGRYVVAGADDRSMVATDPNVEFSFVFFFTYRGILAVYDTKTRTFSPLPGADDPTAAQTNPTFSPDGSYLVFARSKALDIPEAERTGTPMYRDRAVIKRVLAEQGPVRYDLYRMPFNDGRGGEAVPIEGASRNGKSNYFPKISPDGKWLVFTRANQFNLLQPDSRLFIMPAGGGPVREMTCNTPNFNSWHSFSPNGRWMVFASKAYGPYTQLLLTHIDDEGRDTPPVLLEQFVIPKRAANIPEFANIAPGQLERIVADIPPRPRP